MLRQLLRRRLPSALPQMGVNLLQNLRRVPQNLGRLPGIEACLIADSGEAVAETVGSDGKGLHGILNFQINSLLGAVHTSYHRQKRVKAVIITPTNMDMTGHKPWLELLSAPVAHRVAPGHIEKTLEEAKCFL